MKLFINVFVFFLLISCVSGGKGKDLYVKPVKQITYERIQKAILKENIPLALELTSAAERTADILTQKQIDTLKKQAVLKYNDLFLRALSGKNYFEAYKILSSAQNAEITLPASAGFTKKSLIEKLVFSDDSSLTGIARLLYAKKYFDPSVMDDALLKKIITLSKKEGDFGTLKYFLPEIKKRSLHCDPECESILNKKYSSMDLIKGVVTIWVNRGMKIENGAGIPDRVIGSGFFIDRRGYLLTNYHVIESQVDPEYEGYSRLYIKLSGNAKERIPAKVIGWDKIFDIALLKVMVKPKTIFYFGSEKRYSPGTSIIAIGSPGGLENSITSGIISAEGRKFFQMGTALQVDVPVNHGNSGGPLLDEDNNLIGVVFAGIEQFEGVNFAIPEYYVANLLPELYRGGKIQHPFLGMVLYEDKDGLLITYVTPGSSADIAGIKAGDWLISFNGETLHTIDQVHTMFFGFDPDEVIKGVWKHDQHSQTGLLALTVRPDLPVKNAYKKDLYENLFLPLFGMKVDQVSSGIFSRNFIITDILEGSPADNAGLSRNDPFSLQKIKADDKNNILQIQVRIKKRKSGFLEGGLLLQAYMELNSFI